MLADQPKLANYAHEIHRAGIRGAKLTRKLLSFSRQKSTEAVRVELNKLLLTQNDMLQKTLTVRIKLLTKLADDIWPIWLDSSDLEDAILNMCINAMHAMHNMSSGAQLTISTCNQTLSILDSLVLGLKPGDYVQLSIADTGEGMDAMVKEQIFDPFFTTKGEKGTGLGLSQVFGFINRAGGAINVYSEKGIGSRFVLYFPRYIDDDVDVSTESGEYPVDLTGHETILLVDDERGLRDLGKEILTQQGYKVFCAEDGSEALQILEKEAVDLMFSDIIMPEMDGHQLASIVKKKYPAIKIQLASGFNEQRDINAIDESLHRNLLPKPYSSQSLLVKIRFLLDNTNEVSPTKAEKTATNQNKMMPLSWSDALSVGVDEIDDDHKKLILLLNRSIELLKGNGENDEIEAILDELLDYTQYHFQREEKIMEECEYPFLLKHQNVHAMLIKKVQQFIKECKQGTLTSDALFEFLGGWLAEHILGMDKIAASYCKDAKSTLKSSLKK